MDVGDQNSILIFGTHTNSTTPPSLSSPSHNFLTRNRQGWTYNIYDGTYSENASIILDDTPLTLQCKLNEPNPCYLDGEDARLLFVIDTGLSGWTYINDLYIKNGLGMFGGGALIGFSSASKVSWRTRW